MSKNWDNNYNGMWVPNGHGSLFRAMDEDARIIAQCEANKLEWIKAAARQSAQTNNTNLNIPIIPQQPVLNHSVPNEPQQNQSVFNQQPMSELERAIARIKELEEANVAKDHEIIRLNQNLRINHDMVSREEVEEIINEYREKIEKKDEDLIGVRQESAAKDGVITEQARTINIQDKDLEHYHQIKEMQAKEIHELRQDKIESREQVKEHKDLAQEWKFIVKEKNELSQKLAEDLTTKNEKIAQLEQQLVQLYLPHSSNQSHTSWENVDQEDITIPGLIGDINVNYS